jgi:hypothetical protein
MDGSEEQYLQGEAALVGAWHEWKATHNFYRLQEEVVQEHEYKKIGGHGGYAKVRFRCAPADELTFASAADWPETLPPDYRRDLDRMVAVAVVDVLMQGAYPHRGCAVTLLWTKWDDVMSSEAAFYLATKAAMEDLVAGGSWDMAVAPR